MLYPIQTESRALIDLSGIWQFQLDDATETIDPCLPLPNSQPIAVPASFNEQFADPSIRNHAGYVWYQTSFNLPHFLTDERLVLRFGSVTHEAWVYLNGHKIAHHKGGFTPFEVEINDYLQADNQLTIRISNLLDYTTLPVGNYNEEMDEQGHLIRTVDENFDFFNYAGIHRPVKIYSTPKSYIQDIEIVPEVDFDTLTAHIQTTISAHGDYDKIHLQILDEDNQQVADADGTNAELTIKNVHLWQPLDAYLYTLRVNLIKHNQIVDTYSEPFGVRTVEVKNAQFLINNQPFYFKGFGKHEDTYINGRGLNNAYNVIDINLIKQMGANSIRTSHYPYSEEMMRLCDREGIVVIDEVPAVGLIEGFNFNVSDLEHLSKDKTWSVMQTSEAHEQAIRELIARDKNHACVVMWSIANEAANYAPGAHDYFAPKFELARHLDPQKRPCTHISIMMSTPETDDTYDLVDVICLNRYYGWYLNTGDLATAAKDTRTELALYEEKYPDKPIMYTEYGADTIAGFHSAYKEPFSEEFQTAYYKMYSEIFDEFDHFIGEQIWNFADFQTKFGVQRVQGNKKGVFTRAREPKQAASYLKQRWLHIPNFNYKNDKQL